MARLLTTSKNLVEKQPIHDHEPVQQRIDGKQFISLEECMRLFAADPKMKQSTSEAIEYLEEAK